MRKLMACLLAALMLAQPVLALGEGAQSLTMTLETDANRLSPLVTALMGEEDPDLGESLAALINSFVLETCWQEDATVVSLSLEGDTVLDYAATMAGGKACLTSSLVPGYALQTALEQELDWSLLAQADWSVEMALLAEQVETMAASLEQVEETGSFLGDAYEGGVRRVTYRLDDRTIYLLAECLLGTLESSEQLAHATGWSPEECCAAVAQLRSWLLPAALENVYSYQLSLVYDEADVLTGISLTALAGDKQISTLSIGLMADGLEAVWGYGRDGVNDYIRLLALTEETEDGAQALGLRLTVLEDPAHMGYSMVSLMDGAAEEDHMLSLAIYPAETGYSWIGEYQFTTPSGSVTLVGNGTYVPEPFALNAAVDFYETEQSASLMTLWLTSDVCEAVTVDTEGLTIIDMDNMDEETEADLDEAMYSAGTELGLKLLFMLPKELFLLLMQ
ncbi:MAG: hypothetical protein ACI4ML_03680 [Aristaeellaceae bacterium]